MKVGKLLVLSILLFVHVLTFAGDREDAQAAFTRKDFATVIRLMKPYAEEGDPKAQTLLAFVYSFGPVEIRNFAESARFAQKAADQNFPAGKTLLGISYLYGRGLAQDDQKAILFLEEAAAAGDGLGSYEFGKILLIGRGLPPREIAGEQMLRKAAAMAPSIKENVDLILEQKGPLADWRRGLTRLSCNSLSCSMSMGSNRARLKGDEADGLWVEVAARVLKVGKEEDLAYFFLGRAAEGIGAWDAAEIYYRLAAKQLAPDKVCAGVINNCSGIDVPRETATHLVVVVDVRKRLAAVEASRIAAVSAQRKAVDLEEARVQAEHHRLDVLATLADLRRQAEGGSSDSAYTLSQLLLTGGDVPQDERAAISWLGKAAQGGIMAAQYQLAERYRSGRGLPRDDAKAEIWYGRAVAQGDQPSRVALDALQSARQERVIAEAAERRERAAEEAAAAAAAARRQQAERIELERKKKDENAAKLRAL